MNEAGAMPPRRKSWRSLLFVLLAAVLFLGSLAWYTTTNSFQLLLLRRLVTELERATGARVDLGSLHTSPFRLRLEVRDLTMHGLEPPGEIPYAHIDRLAAQIKIISLFGAEFGFDSVVLDHPVFHIVVHADGTTNQPQPKATSESQKSPLEKLFALSISSLEVHQGELLWGDRRIPLDFAAHDVSAAMTRSLLRRRYEGKVSLGKVDTIFDGYRPVTWWAELQFTLHPNNIVISSLKATSDRSSLQAGGRIQDFRQPRFAGDYDLKLDLAQAAAVSRRPEIRRGLLWATGHGEWSAQDFSSRGKLLLKGLDWRDEPMGLHNAGLSTQFSFNAQRLVLSQIEAAVFGGSITGDADMTEWLGLLNRGQNAKRSQDQKGTIRLRLRSLSAAEVAAAFSTSARPFHRVKLAGVTDGLVEIRWKGSPRDAQVQVALSVVPPAHVAYAQLPLTARVQGIYRAGPEEFEISELIAATRATHVQASGTLSRAAAIKLFVSTTDLSEWQPVLSAVGYAEPIPIAVKGEASFRGTASGKLSDMTFSGGLQSRDFDVIIPGTSRRPEKHVHWDSLIATVVLSPEVFAMQRGVLRDAHNSISFDVSAGLEQRHFTDSSPFTGDVNMQNASLGDVLALLGYEYPATGRLDLQLQLSGTRRQPHGAGHVQLRNATLYGQPVENLSSDLAINAGEVKLENVRFNVQDARVTGEASYQLSERSVRFNLTGSNFDLRLVPQLQLSRVLVEGRMDFTAVGSGTLEEPIVNAAIQLHDLTFDHERAGDFILTAVTKGSDLQVTGKSRFAGAELELDGAIHLRDDWPADISLHFTHLDVDSILRTYVRSRLSQHSAVAGDLRLLGPLRNTRELEITGNISDFFADVEDVKIRNSGPILFSISGQLLKIDQVHLIGEGTDLSASGRVQLGGQRGLDLRARGQLNLKLIESFNPDFSSSGMVTMDTTISGTVPSPRMQGRLRIDNGSLAYATLPSMLSDINGTLVFNQDRLQIETLTAHTGGGLVTFGGYATAYNGQLNFDLSVQGQDVRLRYPPGVSSTATADLHFAGTPSGSTLTGDIVVTKLAMTPGFDFGAYLQRSAQSSALPPTNPLLNRIRLDVHIVTTPELQMQTAIIRLSGDADLRLRGTAAKPVILGRADVIEGEVYFNGTKYRFERGDISFTDPVTTRPVLDLQASTRVRDYDITLTLNGEIERPSVTYRSEPPLPTADIIALLAFGQTTEESSRLQQSGQSAFSQETSSAILTAALNATLSNRVQRLFGVSRIKIDPQGLTTETSPTQTGPAVTIEQQVKNNLTLTYTTNVSQTSQQIIQVEYNLTRNVSVVAVRDQNGVVSFDVRVRQRKK
jgi:translocation and assembly module TamB